MALIQYNKKCTSCGGNKWEYLPELKLWRCRYCDAQAERREAYDGLYSIQNVVRQVILDSAYRRMEQADRNLSECQKINARYCGTLIAGMCAGMMAAIAGVSFAGVEPRGQLSRIYRDYTQLIQEGRDISDDEAALYEALDSHDAWAVLALMFDTLNDETRREYLLTMTDPEQIFCRETNQSLLRFALKHSRMDMAEKIANRTDELDPEQALQTVLEHCTDEAAKARMGAALLRAGALKPGKEPLVETYLSGADSNDAKEEIACAVCEAGGVIHMDILQREVLAYADDAAFCRILDALFSRRLYDGEVESLLRFAAAQRDGARCAAIIDRTIDSGRFVSVNPGLLREFVQAPARSVESRLELLPKLRRFTAGDRVWETVAGSYLCQTAEPPESRSAMLDGLCGGISSVPAKDFEQYVLRCTHDGPWKPHQIRRILALPEMNPGFFRELAGKYLKDNRDAPEHRGEVLLALMESGLSIDAGALLEYVCCSSQTPEEKVELVQSALKNGSSMRADGLSMYLEQCAEQFAPELCALLYRDYSTVSRKALENYVLICRDSPGVKVSNAWELGRRSADLFGSSPCRIQYCGWELDCSLAQAYLLTTGDEPGVASEMLTAMTGCGTRLNTAVRVDGVEKRFSRFVQENRELLSPTAEQLCQEYRLFSWFSSF